MNAILNKARHASTNRADLSVREVMQRVAAIKSTWTEQEKGMRAEIGARRRLELEIFLELCDEADSSEAAAVTGSLQFDDSVGHSDCCCTC